MPFEVVASFALVLAGQLLNLFGSQIEDRALGKIQVRIEARIEILNRYSDGIFRQRRKLIALQKSAHVLALLEKGSEIVEVSGADLVNSIGECAVDGQQLLHKSATGVEQL